MNQQWSKTKLFPSILFKERDLHIFLRFVTILVFTFQLGAVLSVKKEFLPRTKQLCTAKICFRKTNVASFELIDLMNLCAVLLRLAWIEIRIVVGLVLVSGLASIIRYFQK